MAEEPSFLTPSTSEQVAREAEIMLLRSMNRNMETMANELSSHRKDFTEIKIDIAEMKVRQQASEKMEATCAGLRKDIDELKARNQQQDGAMTAAKLMKEFGPWLVSLALLFWGLFTRK